jgi:hypothetical protein
MPLPFVLDNQQHRLAGVLNELLAQSIGRPLDIGTAYFAISGYGLVKDGLHQVGAFRLILGAEPHSWTDIGLRPNAADQLPGTSWRVAAPVDLQFGQDSTVLGSTFGAAERPQDKIVPPAVEQANGDARLALVRLFGVSWWRAVWSAWHRQPPGMRMQSAFFRFSMPHFRRSEGLLVAVGKGFTKVGATGLEPVTPSVSSWCSSQLS